MPFIYFLDLLLLNLIARIIADIVNICVYFSSTWMLRKKKYACEYESRWVVHFKNFSFSP